MTPDYESRLLSAVTASETVARKSLEQAIEDARKMRVSSGRVVLDLAMQWAEQFQSTVAVLSEIHNQKPSEKKSTEAIAAMRALATAAAGLSSACLAVLVETQVDIESPPMQPIN